MSIWICSHCLSLYEIICFYRRSTFSTHIPECNLCECKHAHTAHTDRCTLTNTVNTLAYCTHTHHSIHQSFFFFPLFLFLCVLSPYLFTSALSLMHNQRAPHNTHNQRNTHTQARTHKVARLVGATAAALLRSPRVAPGARLPVVCQRLRVEFIQIKAVE